MKYAILILLLFVGILSGQNLVPNPGFEETNDTISGFIRSDTDFEKNINYWIVPNSATPDIITPDFKEKYITAAESRSGSNMIGLSTRALGFEKVYFWSEYIGVQLIKPIEPNQTYYVEYWIRSAHCISPSRNVNEFMVENFGILFTLSASKNKGSISSLDWISGNPDMLIGIPQIKGDTTLYLTENKWEKVSAYFTPKETYEYLYLGHFRTTKGSNPDFMKSYYVIDDVSVVEVTDFEIIDSSSSLPIGSKVPLKNVNFVSGTTKFSNAKSKEVLQKLSAYLRTNSTIRIRIKGHTDSLGNKNSNKELSQNRARTITNFLILKGIAKDRIEWKGYGEELPISDNETEEGRSLNRRVEFEVIE